MERFLRPETLIPPRRLNPAIDPEVERAVLEALALHPDQRPPDAASFKEALLAAPSAAPAPLAVGRTWRILLARLTPLDRAIAAAFAGTLLLAILASLS